MPAMTQDDLKQIKNKLESIEQKIGSKWTLPIMIAVLSGLLGLVTVAVQVKLEHASNEAAKRREQRWQEQRRGVEERAAFYKKMIASATRMHQSFESECRSAAQRDNPKLDEMLEEYRDYALSNISFDQQRVPRIQAYGDWVSERLIECRENLALLDAFRHDNEAKFTDAKSALDEFNEKWCKYGDNDEPSSILSRWLST